VAENKSNGDINKKGKINREKYMPRNKTEGEGGQSKKSCGKREEKKKQKKSTGDEGQNQGGN